MERITELTCKSSIPIFLLALLSLTTLTSKAQTPTYVGDDCTNSTEQTLSSSYQTNVNNILSWLTSSAGTSNGNNYTTINSSAATNDTVYGIFDCRGDVDRSFCQFCVSTASSEMVRRCPNRVSAVIWYDFCYIRYSNQNFIGKFSLGTLWYDLGSKNISNPTEVNTTENYMRNLIRIATVETNQLYAMGEFYLSNGEKRYGLVQCSRDIGKEKCGQCLEGVLEKIPQCCAQKLGWQVFVSGCLMKYTDYMFYTAGGQTTPPTAKQGGTNKSRTIIISIISALVAAALLVCSIYYFLRRKRVKTEMQLLETTPIIFPANAQSENSYEDLPIVPFVIIQESTDNFSEASKLGEGGFGPVYKARQREIQLELMNLSILLQAWTLWREGKSLELMDPTLEKSYIANEVTRCIHIGLLCVQEDAADRPTMSGVVVMLASETMTLPQPNHPAFSVGRMVKEQESTSKSPKDPSINDVTVSHIAPR
ncbi:hypothetical protein L6164_023208 [Bauhinia variegata]|uniref:Uncharacterized protein n=1 Tax=Bauhinia variegata TaxID=167791 RepID=A0ACB9ML42_BAUVA|nr:hypothetical protein L6164_023208 [Bauhinia variegata]